MSTDATLDSFDAVTPTAASPQPERNAAAGTGTDTGQHAIDEFSARMADVSRKRDRLRRDVVDQDSSESFARPQSGASAKHGRASTGDDPATGELPAAWELRVMQGPQAGARMAWPAGTEQIIASENDRADTAPSDGQAGPDRGERQPQAGGQATPTVGASPSGPDPDILLFGSGGPPVRISIESSADGSEATIRVLAGKASLAGHELSSGTAVVWPMFERLTLDNTSLAFGPAARREWPDQAQPAATRPAPRLTETIPGTDDSVNAQPGAVRRHAALWLSCAGAGVFVLCFIAFITLAPTESQPAQPPSMTPAAAVSALAGSGFARLQAGVDSQGLMHIRGRLGTLRQRAQLDAWLVERNVRASVDVVIDETLARNVAEVFRVNDVHVEAIVLRPGSIVAKTAESDARRLKQASDAARRDVQGLAELTVRNSAAPQAPPAPPIPNDPGKRIASLVPGSPGYLVTADGARYFVGAMLPSGHHIVKIAAQSVTVELHGSKTRLDF